MKEIKNLLGNYIIFCQYEKDAEILCSIANELQYKWKNGLSYNDTGWNIYKENTGYDFKNGIVRYVMFKSDNIVNVKDILNNEKSKRFIKCH